jgi:hypothetical protein
LAKLTIDFYPDGSIEKSRTKVCLKNDCYTISTQEIRGHVTVSRDEL